MSSKGLEMPVTGSEKLELPVLGCRFGEKAEHLPIKKRRFLFRTSSPPHDTLSSEVTETVATCLNSSSQEVQPKPVASSPPAESLTMANICQNGSIDNKVHEEKLDNICGISLGSGIGSYGIKSLTAPVTVKLEANSVNLPNISAKGTGLHISTVPFKNGDCSSKATVDNNSTLNNQVTSQGQKSGVCDERLNWDLNTVMAWEESPECNHNMHTSTSYAAQGTKGISKGCKQEQECGTSSENISSKILTNLRSLGHHTVHGKEPEERKPISNVINKLLFPVISSTPPPPPSHVTVSSIKPTVKLEYPPPCPMPAGIGLSLDYSKSKPPSFDRTRSSQENAALSSKVGSGSNINHVSTAVVETSENENLNLSLVTVASVEKEVNEEDDKAKVKRVITSSCITTQDAYKPINQSTTIGSLLAIQSSVSPEGENQPSTVSDAHVPIKHEKSPSTSTPPSVSYNKQVCQMPLDNGFGFENEIQRSEVDNADELSFGYEDSQIEDGEVRESSIQTWEGSEGENRENQHPTTDNNNSNRGNSGSHECVPESSSRIKSTDISGSQKGTDEISSVLLPEKPDTSEQVSNNSEPNETNTREVSMKDESESDQWKMNVSGSETLLPDDYTSVNKIKDLKPYKRESFINRGSRFRMQGSSSSNGDDSGSRSREIRSFKRGKYSPHVRTSNRGGATWNRSPGREERDPPFFRDVDNSTNEACLDQNDDVIRPPRQSFRTRLVGNREEDDFRARLGLRPVGDTRFVGRGRSLRYNSRGGGGRYGGPANGGYDEPLEYSQPFPRRRCFSPTERRENNHPCVHHHSGSTSPPRSRTRSRSPRIRRPRSPNYRFETGGYNLENRWVKYKQQSSVFNNRSPPPIGERLTFYDSPRKTKQNESYRSGPHPGRMSGDVHGGGVVMDHGYRNGGGFVKRHEMGRPLKHMEYDEEDGYGLEFHGRGNPRFRDLSRRGNPREERENW